MKRVAGAPELLNELPWKPFGLNGGLPYRLDAKDPSALDTTWADGTRGDFVVSRAFETEADDAVQARLKAEDWARASTWPHAEPMVFSEEFPRPARVIAITADDEELAVLTDERQVFYRRKFANLFVPDEWMFGWGGGKKLPLYLPDHLTGHRGWALGRITAAAAGYKEGPDGRIFEWGPAAVSMETFVWLSPDGHIIYYLDSGTSPEVEHYVEAPFRGQYRGEAINSSASTIMLIDRFGAVVTKIADFDLLGSTPTHPYCYFEECDHEPYYPPGDIRSGMSDIRLPPEGWAIHQPILPAEAWGPDNYLTTRVSILQTGKGNASRELRVVGKKDGVLGTYYKAITAETWSFRPAPEWDRGFWDIRPEEILQQADLAQYQRPDQLQALHSGEPAVDRPLTGLVELNNNTVLDLKVENYNPRASPWIIELTFGEVVLPMELHVVQAWNPYLDPEWGDPQHAITTFEGTLAYDRADLERRMGAAPSSRQARAVRKLLDKAKNKKFNFVINASADGFEAEPKATRRTGPFHAVAVSSDYGKKTTEEDDLSDWLWSRQAGSMGWQAEADALAARAPTAEACAPEWISWAAEVVELNERIDADLESFRHLAGKAAHMSTFTFSTSGMFYILQLKTLDAMLDASRASRSDDVRPNELRFNVITGVTTRIPYLARNISHIERQRLKHGRDERDAVQPTLEPLVGAARDVAERCR